MERQGRSAEFGETLRKRREALGLDRASVAQMTRINRPFLDALEEGAFAKLPGQVFGRGFLRSIGKALGMTGEETTALIAAYDACWAPEPAKADCLKVQIKNKPYPAPSERIGAALKMVVPSKAVMTAVAALAVASGLGVGGVKAWPRVKAKLASVSWQEKTAASGTAERAAAVEAPAAAASAAAAEDVPAPVAEARSSASEASEDEAPAEAPEPQAVAPAKVASALVEAASVETAQATEASAASPPEANGTAAAPAASGQTLELVVSEPVRVRFDMDSGKAETRELAPQTYRFSFKEQADLLIYDAAALKISFNGRNLGPLGQKGRVRRLSFKAGAPDDRGL